MSAGDVWSELIGMGFSPFKVVCTAHSGTQLVERGGARPAGDGSADVVWLPRGDQRIPQSGTGVTHADGSRTFQLTCVPDGIWRAAQAKAEAEGRTLTAVIVAYLKRYVSTPPRKKADADD